MKSEGGRENGKRKGGREREGKREKDRQRNRKIETERQRKQKKFQVAGEAGLQSRKAILQPLRRSKVHMKFIKYSFP